MKYNVVVPAAGQGKRMGAGRNKQFIELAGKPLLAWTLSVFQQDHWCEGIIIVVNPSETEDVESIVNAYGYSKVTKVAVGGAERQDSVYEGLKQIETEGTVLIHDGARPLITIDAIHRVVEKAEQTQSAVLAVPVKDTVKKADEGVITETLERSSLWAVQTPQAFRLPLIKKAYEQAGIHGVNGTDDASLVEALGFRVSIVSGDYQNIKLTTPDDLEIAEMILKKREGGR